MKIYTKAGPLAFSHMTFSDGQPHFKLEVHDSSFQEVTIEMALKGGNDLLILGLVVATLRGAGFNSIRLDCRYLLGARMDRALSSNEPHTLAVIAGILNSMGFSRVRILDAHSDAAARLIRNAVNVLPKKVVENVYQTLGFPVVVTPDKGAVPRVRALMQGFSYASAICEKERELSTGKLKGFYLVDGASAVKDMNCLIVDDICDGGGTFSGTAKVLKEAGAKKVFLYVTHNVRNMDRLEGIDRLFSTDSYGSGSSYQVSSGPEGIKDRVVIPIDMEKL